jgi:hypothetical protein
VSPNVKAVDDSDNKWGKVGLEVKGRIGKINTQF